MRRICNRLNMRHFITPKFPPGYFVAITLWPVGIFFNSWEWKVTETVRRHESIHWEQQKEMLGILFYVWYGIEYLIKLIYHRNTDKAYRAISFEREARAFEYAVGYPWPLRKRFSWLKFL